MGVASEQETAQVELWMEQYPEVKLEVESIRSAVEGYAVSHSRNPDPSVKEKLMRKINEEKAEAPQKAVVYSISSYFKWAAAASFLLLLGSLALNYYFYNRYSTASTELQTAQQQLAEKQLVADAMHKDMDVVMDKNARPVVLNGTDMAPDAVAKIYWMKNTGEVYVDPTNLPEAPAGMQYQLWAILDGKPLDGGMIETKKGTYHIQKMKTFGKAQAFAITLEKMGGSPTPSKDMIVISKI